MAKGLVQEVYCANSAGRSCNNMRTRWRTKLWHLMQYAAASIPDSDGRADSLDFLKTHRKSTMYVRRENR